MEIRISRSNNMFYGLEGSTVHRPATLEVKALQAVGIVQVGDGLVYSDYSVLDVGESTAWLWGDYEVTIRRVDTKQVRVGNVIPLVRFQRAIKERDNQ